MNHPMRRYKQELSRKRTEEIFQRATSGVLALIDDAGEPYAVPLSHVYHAGRLYFHTAHTGHKVDAVRRNSHASFCVIDQDMVVPEELTTYFRSAIAFGKIRILEDETEKRRAIELLGARFIEDADFCKKEIERLWNAFDVMEFVIERMTGKEARELMEKEQAKEQAQEKEQK